MIEVKDVVGRSITYHCPACELKLSVPVEWTWEIGKGDKKREKFLSAHEHCGEEVPELWTEETKRAWNDDVKILRSIYAENPGIGLSLAMEKLAQRKQDIEEMK